MTTQTQTQSVWHVGWRAVMAEEFTFANVHRAVHGISRYVASQKASGAKVIVGAIRAFWGVVCAVAAESSRAMDYAAGHCGACAYTNDFLRGHSVEGRWRHQLHRFAQSPEYSGIKFSTPTERPLCGSDQDHRGRDCGVRCESANAAAAKAQAQAIDPKQMYLSRLREIVDLDAIKKAGIKIAFDPMWGSAAAIPTRFCAMRA